MNTQTCKCLMSIFWGWTTCKCYSAYILVQLKCVHVCSCYHMQQEDGVSRTHEFHLGTFREMFQGHFLLNWGKKGNVVSHMFLRLKVQEISRHQLSPSLYVLFYLKYVFRKKLIFYRYNWLFWSPTFLLGFSLSGKHPEKIAIKWVTHLVPDDSHAAVK